MITDQDKLDCAVREVKQRQHVYARLVERGAMTRQRADREIAVMEAIADDYRDRLKHEYLL